MTVWRRSASRTRSEPSEPPPSATTSASSRASSSSTTSSSRRRNSDSPSRSKYCSRGSPSSRSSSRSESSASVPSSAATVRAALVLPAPMKPMKTRAPALRPAGTGGTSSDSIRPETLLGGGDLSVVLPSVRHGGQKGARSGGGG